MQPSNYQENEQNFQSKFSKLNTVTPLSKYLAMTLFVILPFLGGLIGYNIALHNYPETTPTIELSGNGIQQEESLSLEEKVIEDNPKFHPFISPECSELSSDADQYYAVYKNELTVGQQHRCDHERLTGQTYKLSSTTIRVVEWDIAVLLSGGFSTTSYEVYENVAVPEDRMFLTQVPYLTLLATTSNSLILTNHCFVAKACSFGGLYRYNLDSRSLTLMNNQYFNVTSMASRLSPDRTKILSSDENYNFDTPNNLYYTNLITDSVTVLDTVDPTKGEGSFCTGGMGGCADIVVEWVDDNTVEVQVFKKDKQETRSYKLN